MQRRSLSLHCRSIESELVNVETARASRQEPPFNLRQICPTLPHSLHSSFSHGIHLTCRYSEVVPRFGRRHCPSHSEGETSVRANVIANTPPRS